MTLQKSNMSSDKVMPSLSCRRLRATSFAATYSDDALHNLEHTTELYLVTFRDIAPPHTEASDIKVCYIELGEVGYGSCF